MENRPNPYQLYRFFDAKGLLLYVGITQDWVTRLKQHRSQRPWFDDVVNVTIMRFASEAEATKAEVEAIKAERPRYNNLHADPTTRDPEPDRETHPYRWLAWLNRGNQRQKRQERQRRLGDQ